MLHPLIVDQGIGKLYSTRRHKSLVILHSRKEKVIGICTYMVVKCVFIFYFFLKGKYNRWPLTRLSYCQVNVASVWKRHTTTMKLEQNNKRKLNKLKIHKKTLKNWKQQDRPKRRLEPTAPDSTPSPGLNLYICLHNSIRRTRTLCLNVLEDG
mgnify:CR=1 FL=1